MKINMDIRYALVMLLDLATQQETEARGVLKISLTHDYSLKFMEAVGVALKKAGIIKSIQGRHGGYVLNMPPEKITFKMVYDCFTKPPQRVGAADHTGVTLAVEDLIVNYYDMHKAVLEVITLENLIQIYADQQR